MIGSIWDDVKREFGRGNMVTRLIFINVGVFVLINLVKIIIRVSTGFGELPYFDDFLHLFCVSSNLWYDITHPWVIFTSIFLHEGFWHILFNMLFLFWFGRIVGDLIGNKHILPMYLLGGLAGNLAFILSANLFGYGSIAGNFALGASGAVMAIVVASAVLAPDYMMYLLLIGPVRLKYIVAVLVFLDMIGIANQANTGGHFAHLGGALFGWFYVIKLRQGQNFAEPVHAILDKISSFLSAIPAWLSGRSRGPKVVFRNKERMNQKGHSVSDSDDSSHQEQLDAILDKIKVNGYESLTSDEKEFLFKASKK